MKKVLAVLVSATLSTVAIADTPSGYFVGGFVEKNITDNDKESGARYDFIKNGDGLGLEFGYLYNSQWGGRIEWSNLSFDNALGGSDVSGDRYGLDLLYRFKEQGDIYGILGLKQLEAGDGHTALNLGFGFNKMTSEHLAIFAEGAGYAGLDKSFVDFGVKLGLSYHFDAAEGQSTVAMPVAMPEPDADQDGVIDRLDRCLDTAAGQAVGSNGCELDSDSDGIVDRLDSCPNTNATHLVDQNGCTVYEDKQVSINLNIQFANNSAEVPQESLTEIERVADFMKRFSDTSVEIEGHSSAKGNQDYNMSLSDRRAQAVADLLVSNFGIAAERVSYKGYGDSQLLDTSNAPEADLKNRRIEAVVTGEERRAKLR